MRIQGEMVATEEKMLKAEAKLDKTSREVKSLPGDVGPSPRNCRARRKSGVRVRGTMWRT